MKTLQRSIPFLILFAACSLPPVQEEATTSAIEAEASETVIIEPEPWVTATPAWENRSFGGVVEPDVQGEVTRSGWPQHESDAEPQGSRMFLLERYQEVVDERDGMARELMGLNAMIEAVRGQMAELRVELSASNATSDDRQSNIERLMAENTALAERLTIAQIARLEAERILLEQSIERIQIDALVNGVKTESATSNKTTTSTKATTAGTK
jgi:hypothetical protein